MGDTTEGLISIEKEGVASKEEVQTTHARIIRELADYPESSCFQRT